MIESKEIGTVKAQATRLVTASNALVINSKETLEEATDILSKVKTVGKEIKARKEEITKPLMEALNSARDLFKPIEASHAEAERIIKGKMGDYMDEQDRIAQEAKDKIAAKAASGKILPETAIRKMDEVEAAPTGAAGEVGSISRRTIRKVALVDIDEAYKGFVEEFLGRPLTANELVNTRRPREYFVPNMMLINELMLKGNIAIPGFKVEEEKVIAAR